MTYSSICWSKNYVYHSSYLNIHLHHWGKRTDAWCYLNTRTDMLQWLWIVVPILCEWPGPSIHYPLWTRTQLITATVRIGQWPHLQNRRTPDKIRLRCRTVSGIISAQLHQFWENNKLIRKHPGFTASLIFRMVCTQNIHMEPFDSIELWHWQNLRF